MLEDVTSRLAFERQVIEAGRMAAVTQLAGGVAHEINNQMMAVLGFATFLNRTLKLAESESDDLRRILKAAARAADITRQLLIFSRRQPIAPRPVDLNALIAASEGVLTRVLGPELELQLRLGEFVGTVRVDQAQFEQVLVNLAVNARDAMEPGGRLTVETTTFTAAATLRPRSSGAYVPFGQYARLIVSDTGVGMDEATRVRVFEPFFTTKPTGLGTGLGLASVYGAIKQSGGFIGVDSEPGRGTTFTIDLPQVDVDVVPMAPLPPTVAPRGSETILVAEDDEPVRSWISRSLGELGYRVLEAADEHEALGLLESDRNIALVLTDVVMSGMGGLELRRRVADMRPGLPVLFMSGYALDELIARRIVGPEEVLLAKPFNVELLATRIREQLDSASN